MRPLTDLMEPLRHVIFCPGPGKYLTLAQYCTVVRAAKEHPAQEYPTTFCSWAGGTGADIVQEFRKGLADRINAHLPWYGRGRKWSGDMSVPARRSLFNRRV